jgi:hypothetical protein
LNPRRSLRSPPEPSPAPAFRAHRVLRVGSQRVSIRTKCHCRQRNRTTAPALRERPFQTWRTAPRQRAFAWILPSQLRQMAVLPHVSATTAGSSSTPPRFVISTTVTPSPVTVPRPHRRTCSRSHRYQRPPRPAQLPLRRRLHLPRQPRGNTLHQRHSKTRVPARSRCLETLFLELTASIGGKRLAEGAPGLVQILVPAETLPCLFFSFP